MFIVPQKIVKAVQVKSADQLKAKAVKPHFNWHRIALKITILNLTI